MSAEIPTSPDLQVTYPHIRLVTPPLLKELGVFVSCSKMDVTGTADKLLHRRRPIIKEFESENHRTMLLFQFGSLIAELRVNDLLSDFRKRHPDDVIVDPIPAGARTQQYYWGNDSKGRFVVRACRTHEKVAEYDGLAAVTGVPVVIEVKTGKPKVRGVQVKGESDAITVMKSTNKKLHPVSDYYNDSSCGYVLVGFFSDDPVAVVASSYRESFVKQGGLLVPFPIARRSFLREVQKYTDSLGGIPQ